MDGTLILEMGNGTASERSAAVWHVYMVECADGTFYTGVATDIEARVVRHNLGKGAKYTRGRRPVRLVYRERLDGRGDALRREHEIKQLPRQRKRALIKAAG